MIAARNPTSMPTPCPVSGRCAPDTCMTADATPAAAGGGVGGILQPAGVLDSDAVDAQCMAGLLDAVRLLAVNAGQGHRVLAGGHDAVRGQQGADGVGPTAGDGGGDSAGVVGVCAETDVRVQGGWVKRVLSPPGPASGEPAGPGGVCRLARAAGTAVAPGLGSSRYRALSAELRGLVMPRIRCTIRGRPCGY